PLGHHCREQHAAPLLTRRPQGVLADFAPSVPPLVPALVVQCVTEVETRGLAEVGAAAAGLPGVPWGCRASRGSAVLLSPFSPHPQTGLYRVPGAEQLVREWKQRLLRAGEAPPALGAVADVHVLCGVLKDFLRGLQEPLVTFSLHAAFLQAAGEGRARRADIPDEAACSAALCHVVTKLPPANRDTLAFLMLHLLR
uniref:Rho-GAP domain-containing protein n=1 Tax=Nothoprocta perdicaria TaxID=30464 RepID=A0A8C6Z3K7_NOTPE